MDYRNAVETYLERCTQIRRLSPKTVRAYWADLTQFVDWVEDHDRGPLAQNDLVDRYLAHLNKHYKPRSVRRKITSIRSFVKSLGEDACELEQFADMKNEARIPKNLPRTVRPDDLRRMIELAEQEYDNAKNCTSYAVFYAARTSATLELLTATGMRISELCSLGDEDVDLGGRALRIFGKGSKERIVQLECMATIEALERYITARDDHFPSQTAVLNGHRLFVSNVGGPFTDQAARACIESLADRAGTCTHVTPHMIRHTFATLLLEQDVSIRYIQNLLGHSSVKTTEIYTHVSSAKQREIMREKNPRDYICGP